MERPARTERRDADRGEGRLLPGVRPASDAWAAARLRDPLAAVDIDLDAAASQAAADARGLKGAVVAPLVSAARSIRDTHRAGAVAVVAALPVAYPGEPRRAHPARRLPAEPTEQGVRDGAPGVERRAAPEPSAVAVSATWAAVPRYEGESWVVPRVLEAGSPAWRRLRRGPAGQRPVAVPALVLAAALLARQRALRRLQSALVRRPARPAARRSAPVRRPARRPVRGARPRLPERRRRAAAAPP